MHNERPDPIFLIFQNVKCVGGIMSTIVFMLPGRVALQDLQKFSHIVHTVTYA